MGQSSQSQYSGYVPVERQQHYEAPPAEGHPYYVYLPPAPRRRRLRRHSASCWLSVLVVVLLLGVAGYLFWPRRAHVTISRLKLEGIKVDVKSGRSIIPKVFLDIKLKLRLKVKNPNYFGVSYNSVTVGISYDDEKIGEVESEGGKVPAHGIAYVSATLELNGAVVVDNVLGLLADLAQGQLPLQTVTHFDGWIKVLFFEVPMEANMSCNVVIDPQDQIILSRDCDVESCC